MEVIFLGTSSMVPTKERNQSAVLIRYKNEGILVDCGEGTQRQFKQKGIPLTKITKILITHWHGDHVFGIPGVMSTLGASEYNRTLEIYGPKGTKKHIEAMFSAFVFDRRIKFEVKEISEGKFFENDEFYLETLPLEHGIITLGYNFIEKDIRHIDIKKVKKLGVPDGPLMGELQDNKEISFKGRKIKPEDVTYVEKGKKISVIADTIPCNNAVKLAENADLLICEATYSSKLEGKGEEYGHMTGKQAGMIANQANVKKLVLTHFSARYKTTQEVEEDAKDVFANCVAANDFMVFKV
ncbi:MAG: ribonuclease Z [Nanoarchaeota archaeon]|nr:ribonuclease Z [Nanoarchaeota archaeon]MBU1946512.1 ribonuclease Z [Nanoarchaeota archaeon]